ncbi:hypothetical protein H206_00593 [Candidatus Electrothrix aarhusensis]|uniref:Uncharacterized protein n=1 Tax=Candidatus Electrothrix aarhusensis TaxID=1859131 RepID=A0A3S3R399_9BACT|nr:hypothetical protein H206_00593 [Candidatus Electrothrix aarhusensis]
MIKHFFCLLCIAATIGLFSLSGFCEDNAFSDGFKKGVGEELGRVVTQAIIAAARNKKYIQSSCALSLVKPLNIPHIDYASSSMRIPGAVVENKSITSSGEFALIVYLTNQQSYSGGKIIGHAVQFSRFDPLPGQSILNDVNLEHNYLGIDPDLKLDEENQKILFVLTGTCDNGEKKMLDYAYLFDWD